MKNIIKTTQNVTQTTILNHSPICPLNLFVGLHFISLTNQFVKGRSKGGGRFFSFLFLHISKIKKKNPKTIP